MWGRERGKVKESVGKLSQNTLFLNFFPKFITDGNVRSKNM